MKDGSSFARNQGTLIALACAAAFAAPQAANAQRELYDVVKADGHPLTLQGNISIGYARHKTTNSAGGAAFDGPERGNVWSGESNIRFSASSKLSQGFIEGIGFQVESGFETSDGTFSGSQGTLASRNTALGLKTSIGTVFGGRWDTPYKLSLGNFYHSVSANGLGASSTGFLGTPGIGGGSFTGTQNSFSSTSGTNTNGPIAGNPYGSVTGGATTSVPATMNFRRRQGNTLNFYTPNISGFSAGFQYGPDEELGAGSPTFKPTMWSATAGYARGPLAVSVAYEKHSDYLWGGAVGNKLSGSGVASAASNAAGLGTNSSDHAIHLGVSYQFGPVRWSGYWERLSYSQSGPAVQLRDIEGSKWYTGATWRISGPHVLMGAYGRASSLSCGATATWTGTCADTGSQIWNFLYRYQLDRVSYVNVFYGQLSNDRNANFVATNAAGTSTATTSDGHKDSGWSIGIQTSF